MRLAHHSAAAVLLGLLCLAPATLADDGPTVAPLPAAAEGMHLVLGSFSNRRRAELWTRALARKVPVDLHIASATVAAGHQHAEQLPRTVYRVLAGPFQRARAGNAARQQAWAAGIMDAWFLHDLSRLGTDVQIVAKVPSTAPKPAASEPPPTASTAAPAPAATPAATDPPPAPIFVSQGPPPGFEHLLAEQTTMVDLYYSNRLLGSTLATYDQHSITLTRAEDVVRQVPNLLDAAPVNDALSAPLANNSHLICTPGVNAACGVLQPRVAGVIFDADRFRVDLFIHPDHLRTTTPDMAMYLPGADPHFSFLHNLNAAVSGSAAAGANRSYSASLNSTFAWGENRVAAVTNINDGNGLAVDALYFQRDHQGQEYAAGLFRNQARSLPFSGNSDLYGVRVGSSLRTRADLDHADAAPLEVFLPARGRVEVLRDGRLLLATFMEAGSHLLDTSQLPEGAYDITLRVRDSNGTREETRFFVKTSRLPPAGTTLWFMEGGRVADRSDGSLIARDTGEWLVRGGASRRLTEHLGIEGGLSLSASDTGNNALAEAGVFHLGRHHAVQANLFAARDGARGLATNVNLQVGQLHASADVRRVWQDSDNTGNGVLSQQALRQDTVHLNYPLAGGYLRASARRAQRGDFAATDSQALGWSSQPLLAWGGSLELTLDVHRQGDDTQALAGMRWLLHRGAVAVEVLPQYRFDDRGSNGMQLSSFVGWQGSGPGGSDMQTSVQALSRAGYSSVGGNLAIGHRRGEANLGLDWSDGEDGRNLSWSGTLNTSVLGTADGFNIGGRNQAQAAILVQLDGQAADARMEVLVDGHPVGVAQAGTTTAIHLKPFESYEIRLRALGDALLNFDDRPEYVTLYPGNVVRLSWRADAVVVVLGRVVDEAGALVANTVVEGASGLASTDRHGMLQAEVVANQSVVALRLAHRGGCTVQAPIASSHQGVAMVGTLTCVADRP